MVPPKKKEISQNVLLSQIHMRFEYHTARQYMRGVGMLLNLKSHQLPPEDIWFRPGVVVRLLQHNQ